jgi:hypothetical protein
MTKNVKDIGAASEEKTGDIIESTRTVPEDIYCDKDRDCDKINSSWSCDTAERHCQ